MGRKNKLFKSEELKSRQEVAAFLKELAEKLEVNRLVLSRGAENVSLNIPDNISLGIVSESKKKKGKRKHSLELEMEWLEEITSECHVICNCLRRLGWIDEICRLPFRTV